MLNATKTAPIPRLKIAFLAMALSFVPTLSMADLDGHGPDAWRVTGVSSNDVLNARMGPGTSYPVIETFAHNERGMKQITCVPYYTLAHYERMGEAQINALPPRWCLMRNASLSKAGWVAQRFITPDESFAASHHAAPQPTTRPTSPSATRPSSATSGDALIDDARDLVQQLYDALEQAERGRGRDPLEGPLAGRYFTSDIVALFRSGGVGAHPVYGAQDFDGRIIRITPDADTPMLRGMITINVDFTNFGERQRAVYFLRIDPENGGALRIFRVEHEGWSYP